MKKLVLIFGILLSSLSVNAQKMEAKDLAEKISKQPLLIDVRTADEYAHGTILGAMNLDVHSENFMRTVQDIPKNKEIIVFCQSGERSNEAFEMLRSFGFEKVSQLIGGYDSWRQQKETHDEANTPRDKK